MCYYLSDRSTCLQGKTAVERRIMSHHQQVYYSSVGKLKFKVHKNSSHLNPQIYI